MGRFSSAIMNYMKNCRKLQNMTYKIHRQNNIDNQKNKQTINDRNNASGRNYIDIKNVK